MSQNNNYKVLNGWYNNGISFISKYPINMFI